GLGLRVAMLHREGVPLASAVTSQAVEKVLEGIGLALLTVPLLATQELEPRLAASLRWCAIGGGVALGVLVIVSLVWRKKLALVLGTFGVDADPALGFGLLYHALHTIPVTLIGIPGFFRAARLPTLELPREQAE